MADIEAQRDGTRARVLQKGLDLVLVLDDRVTMRWYTVEIPVLRRVGGDSVQGFQLLDQLSLSSSAGAMRASRAHIGVSSTARGAGP